MSILLFEDNEYYEIIETISVLQCIFFNKSSPTGKFDFAKVEQLKKLNTPIIIDNNILSPICECIRKGTLNDKSTLRKIGLIITFSKIIGAQLSCGFCLNESETAMLTEHPAKELRQQFLYALDEIPPMVWKEIGCGYLDNIPESYLKNYNYKEDLGLYKRENDLTFLIIKASVFKMVNLIRDHSLTPFEKFIQFFNWMLDNLAIVESVIMYAGLVFGEIKGIRKPKKVNSKNYALVEKGIDNQSWDLYYVSIWSQFYYNCEENEDYGFATDDSTLKYIIVNILPKGTVTKNLLCVFNTHNQRRVLQDIYQLKMGANRKKRFELNETERGIAITKQLIFEESETLKGRLS